MFCVSDRPFPIFPQYQAAIFMPPPGVPTMMTSSMPREQAAMMNFRSGLPPLPTTRCDLRTTSASPPDGLSPTRLEAAVRKRLDCTDATTSSSGAAGTTSFRIADILDWRVGSSGPRVAHTTAVDERRRTAGSQSIVRPWDERPSSTAASSSSGPEEDFHLSDGDGEAPEIDVEDASCSATSSSSSDQQDVCPLGALLRMTSQTNFDDCANRLQQCFNDGRYIRLPSHVHVQYY